jgi:predicted permease
MRNLRSWTMRLANLFRKERQDRELDEELSSHLALHIEDNLRAGMTPEEALRNALMKLGGVEQTKENYRDQRSIPFVETFLQDLRFGLRLLRKDPGFAVVAVLSLALSIGVNTVIFSAVNNVLLHSLPYLEPSRLYAVWSRAATHGVEPMHVSAADFYDWQSQSRAFQSLSAYASWPMNLTNVDEPRRLQTQLVSANLLSTLGVNPEIGRTFATDEDLEQSAPVIVISHHLWREIGGSPRVVGSRLTINGSLTTVIGVMPGDFAFPSKETDAWVPLSLNEKNRANREGRWLSVTGRLAPNVNESAALTELDLISTRLAAAYPATNRGWSASLVPLREEVVGKTGPILLTLHACGLLLLFITCTNLANLLLARGIARSHEFAMRLALIVCEFFDK